MTLFAIHSDNLDPSKALGVKKQNSIKATTGLSQKGEREFGRELTNDNS